MAKDYFGTHSLPSGVDGDLLVCETWAKAIGTKAFDTALLSQVIMVPAASAFLQTEATTIDDGDTYEETETSSPDQYVFEQTRVVLQTYRTSQSISNELIADSTVAEFVQGVMASALAEKLNTAIATAISLKVGATDRHHREITTGGTPTQPILQQIIFGFPASSGGFTTGSNFTNAQRARMLILSHGTTLGAFFLNSLNTATNNVPFGFSSNQRGEVLYTSGIPWLTVSGMIANATNGTVLQPHILMVDASAVTLAHQSLVVSIDTESQAAENVSVFHASIRAAITLTSYKHAAGYSLRTIIGGE